MFDLTRSFKKGINWAKQLSQYKTYPEHYTSTMPDMENSCASLFWLL